MFRDTPRNFITITDLIEKYNSINSPDAKRVASLLKVTRDFLNRTAPDMQAAREKWIDEPAINKILDDMSAGLATFLNAQEKMNEQTTSVYSYCQETIKDRLHALKAKKDKIYLYYDTHQSELKLKLTATEQLSKNKSW